MLIGTKRNWQMMGIIALLALLLPLTATLAPVQAQTDEQCFQETGLCVSGRILQYWQQNGGLPVFGLPITTQREETIGDWTGQVQWFERNRLELHPENAPPYDVLLGRLGGTFVEREGASPPREEPRAGCTYFNETGFNVCGDFLAYWSSNGLNLDGQPGFTAQESLALFGFPLTGEFRTTLEDGNTYTVQWFERARFERHPENAPPYNVLLSRLGVVEVGAPQTQPGTGGRIAFASNRTGTVEIYLMNTDGGNVTRLTSEGGTIPTWSPDGSRIAFASDRDGNNEIYVMNADGSNQTRLTNNPGSDFHPSWSPDGSRIAYQSKDENGDVFIYTMNSDGSNQTRLTDRTGYHPDWSPDGTQIAFVALWTPRSEPTEQIWVMNADGSNPTMLTSFSWSCGCTINNFGPAWSPDGSRIAFTSYNSFYYNIYVIDADGSNNTPLTSTRADFFPDWSPDGSQIVFSSRRDGNSEIYVMNADGSDQIRLTNANGPASNVLPAWSPN